MLFRSQVRVLDAEEDWYKVQYNDLIGYVYNNLLSITMYTWSAAGFREYPTGESVEIDTIPAKQRLQVLGTTGDWSKVVYNGKEGYVFSTFLTYDGNPPTTYDFSEFGVNMDNFVNNNSIKSPTENLIVTDLTNFFTYVYEKNSSGTWKRMFKWSCTVDRKSVG